MAVLLYRDTTGWKYVGVPPHDHGSSVGRIVGEIMAFGGPVAPAGWLACDGTLVSTTTYAALFAVLGYSWGGGGASFALPDMRSRSALGLGGTQGTAVGVRGGSDLHTHVGNPMGTHDHAGIAVNSASVGHTHTVDPASVSTGSAGSHSHTSAGPSQLVSTYDGSNAGASPASSSHTHGIGSNGSHTHSLNIPSTGTSSASHAHSVTANVSATSAGTPSVQQASSHDPYSVVNYVIFAG